MARAGIPAAVSKVQPVTPTRRPSLSPVHHDSPMAKRPKVDIYNLAGVRANRLGGNGSNARPGKLYFAAGKAVDRTAGEVVIGRLCG